MNSAQWLKLVRDYPKRLGKIDRTNDDGLPIAMFAFWRLLRQAPSTDLALFERIGEKDLLEAAEAVTPSLSRPGFGYDPHEVDSPAAAIRLAATYLRAIDLLAAALHNGSLSANPAAEYAVQFGKERGFVIPVERRLWRAQKLPKDDKAPFSQRGVTRHRILPSEIDGAKVIPYRGHWPSGTMDRANFGAALFPGLTFECDENEESFVVTGVACANHGEVVGHALANSHVHNCLVTIFPELTIDDPTLARITADLAKKPWYDDPDLPVGRTPAFVVAGSWHRSKRGKLYNLAPVHDGDGRRILEHRKRKVYKDPEGRHERIEPGTTLPILVFDHCLFAFGICLDFCDVQYSMGYDDLDVDMVLVPSCGHDSTMESHLDNAKRLMKQRKSRTMVVQQLYPSHPTQAGYILPPHAKVAATVAPLATEKSWDIIETHFSPSR